MSELPFWAYSPSPFTLVFYAVCCIYGAIKIYRNYGWAYKRVPKLTAITDAVFMFGFVVVFLDTVWILASLFRFGAMFPDSILQLLACLLRNVGIVALCYLYAKPFLTERATAKTAYMFLITSAFIVVWFILSPSPAYTDWTFALRFGYPLPTAITSFLISHVLGKFLTGITFLTYWRWRN